MKKQTVVISALIVAIVCLAIAQPNATQTRTTTTNTQTANGRWQIVNGTPEMTRNIMLLDTQTGDSWINCSDSKGATNWCSMSRGYEQVGMTQPSEVPAPQPAQVPMPKCLRYYESGICAEYEKP
jgi:hypothetical protein